VRLGSAVTQTKYLVHVLSTRRAPHGAHYPTAHYKEECSSMTKQAVSSNDSIGPPKSWLHMLHSKHLNSGRDSATQHMKYTADELAPLRYQGQCTCDVWAVKSGAMSPRRRLGMVTVCKRDQRDIEKAGVDYYCEAVWACMYWEGGEQSKAGAVSSGMGGGGRLPVPTQCAAFSKLCPRYWTYGCVCVGVGCCFTSKRKN
jgi:hypothetical protein